MNVLLITCVPQAGSRFIAVANESLGAVKRASANLQVMLSLAGYEHAAHLRKVTVMFAQQKCILFVHAQLCHAMASINRCIGVTKVQLLNYLNIESGY
ncbi:MAG: hypothetical protein ACNA7I_10265, partial [Candidatus Methanoperedens sp.]